ncbi:MAG: transglutaminase-like domain-containing protein, partial [Candidatus Omnitrophota bacterium]
MRKRIVFFLILAIAGVNLHDATYAIGSKEKDFVIEEKIFLEELPADISELRIWIPYPVNDNWQEVEDFKIDGEFESRIVKDKRFGNNAVFLTPKKDIDLESASKISVSFRVKRREYNGEYQSLSLKERQGFLKADRGVPVSGRIKKLAHQITKGKKEELEKVRAIYEYLINELNYSKDDPNVCGIGNSLLTLKHKKGICTDYHSLFVSMARSIGIPAKFEIGLGIPQDSQEGHLHGYHCWAKFYIRGEGWVGVDVSEADKHPEKIEYFFGHLDENRVHLTTGRDIKLDFAMNQSPLNYFVFPYAELNGRQFTDVNFDLT